MHQKTVQSINQPSGLLAYCCFLTHCIPIHNSASVGSVGSVGCVGSVGWRTMLVVVHHSPIYHSIAISRHGEVIVPVHVQDWDIEFIANMVILKRCALIRHLVVGQGLD